MLPPDTIAFSANRFGKWGECETRALHDEIVPAEHTSGPEALLGNAGHESIECTLMRRYEDPAGFLRVAFSNITVADVPLNERGVSDRMIGEYAEALADLVKRADLWPAYDEILTVEAHGIPRRNLEPDIHGKPGFGVVFATLPDGKALGIRGRLDVVSVPTADPACCLVTDWGFAAEKPVIAGKAQAVAAWRMFPGFARYTARQVYLMAGLRKVEHTYTAEEMPLLVAELAERAGEIIAKRASGATATTPNKRCGDCRLRATCEPYQQALQPLAPPAEVVRWPTDLAALTTPDLLETYQRFDAPRKAVAAYWDELGDELKERLAGEESRVTGEGGNGIRLSLEGNGFAYPDITKYLAWVVEYGLALAKAVQPVANEDALRLVNGITDEAKRKAALEALDKIRTPRQQKRVLRPVTNKKPKKLAPASEAKEAA